MGRRCRLLVVACCAAAGCSFDASGSGQSGGDEESSSGSTTDGASTSQTTTGTQDSQGAGSDTTTGTSNGTTATTASSMTTSNPTSTTDAPTSSGTGDGSTGEFQSAGITCRTLKEDDPSLNDGFYDLETPEGAAYRSFCNMTIDGGGWTLIARTENPSPNVPFGWQSQNGGAENYNDAFSLGVPQHGLRFEQVLIGNRMTYEVVEWGYVIDVPPNFIEAYANSAFEVQSITTAVGDCNPAGGPTMLRNIGHTALTDHFFMRDQTDPVNFGLFPDVFNTASSSCEQGGYLDNDRGVIFVR